MGRGAVTLGAIALACLAVGAQSAAAGPWSAAVPLSPPGSGDPAVDMNPRGDVAVAWSGPVSSFAPPSDHIDALTQPAGGAFTAPQRLFDGHASDPTVAVGDDGRTLAIWPQVEPPGPTPQRDAGREWAAQGAVGGAFGSPTPIGSGFAVANTLGQTGLAIGRDGEAVAAWLDQASAQVRAAWRPPGGTFGPAQRVSRGPTASRASVAIDSAGVPIVVWEGAAEGESFASLWHVYVSNGTPDHSFGAPMMVSDPGRDTRGDGPVVGTAANGDVIVAWNIGLREVNAVVRGAGGGFASPQPLGDGRQVQIATSPRGDAVVAWGDDTKIAIAARRLDATRFEPATLVTSARNEAISSFRVGVDAGANVSAVYGVEVRSPATGRRIGGAVRATVRRSDGRLLPSQTLTPLGGGNFGWARDAYGRGLAVWQSQTSEGQQVFAAAYDQARLGPSDRLLGSLAVERSARAGPHVRFRLAHPARTRISLYRARPRLRRIRNVFVRGHRGVNRVALARLALPHGRYRIVAGAVDIVGRPLASRTRDLWL